MKLKSINFSVLAGWLLLLIAASCSKMNDLHDPYLKRGETIYVGQPDSVKAFPGNGRVVIRYWLSDPKAKKLKIYWNAKRDSLVLDVPAKAAADPVDVSISGLSENQYVFVLVTSGTDFKNPSIPLEVSAKVLGQNYLLSRFDRQIRYATYAAADRVTIVWQGNAEDAIGTDFRYRNQVGELVELYAPADASSTMLEDFAGELTYRTRFVPLNAVDTMVTPFREVTGIDRPVSSSTFARWNPAGIPYNDIGAAYSIEKMWDGSKDTWFITNVASFPHSFTFDMGAVKNINRIRQWQRLTSSVVYRIQNVRKFEVWGSATPGVTNTFEGWAKLGTFESKKPSGAATGTETAEDLAYAAAGEDFLIAPGSPAVRYIRYVVLSTWDNAKVAAVGEVSFFEK